jgi:hypothetical protein
MKDIFSHPIKGFGVLSDYARKHAVLRTGVGSQGKLENLSEAIQEQAQATDKILRKHGKGIIGQQFDSHRLAEIMIDLFVMAATISRVQASIDAKGVEGAALEIDILKTFTRAAKVRIKHNFRRIDTNDDEMLKGLADDAFEVEGFRWDTI